MKKEYIEPQMEAIMIRNCSQLLAGSPNLLDEVSTNPSYSPELGVFFNDADLDFMFAD